MFPTVCVYLTAVLKDFCQLINELFIKLLYSHKTFMFYLKKKKDFKFENKIPWNCTYKLTILNYLNNTTIQNASNLKVYIL